MSFCGEAAMRNISVSTEVFAAIWAHRKPGRRDRRRHPRTHPARACSAFHSSRMSAVEAEQHSGEMWIEEYDLRLPAGFQIFRTYKEKFYTATVENGRWHLHNDEQVLPVPEQIEPGSRAPRRERLEELELQRRKGTHLQHNPIEAPRTGQEENEHGRSGVGRFEPGSDAHRTNIALRSLTLVPSRARHEQVAHRVERRPGVVAGGHRPWPPRRPPASARRCAAVGEGAGIVLRTRRCRRYRPPARGCPATPAMPIAKASRNSLLRPPLPLARSVTVASPPDRISTRFLERPVARAPHRGRSRRARRRPDAPHPRSNPTGSPPRRPGA